MNIYRLDSDGDVYESLIFKDKHDWKTVTEFSDQGKPAELWTPLAVDRYNKPYSGRRKKREPSDFPFMSPLDVFSEKAVNALGTMLSGNGTLLPFKHPESRFYLFLPDRVLDVLDEARSKLWKLDTGRIVSIDEFVFRPDAKFEASIFQIPQLRFKQTFVTEDFVTAVQAHDLRGFKFPKVWE